MTDSPDLKRITVLWIAPNLNDYKARFLDVLTADGGPELTVLAGAADSRVGHKYGVTEHLFQRVDVAASKSMFAVSPRVFFTLWQVLCGGSYDVVLMPMEKKHLPMILFLGVVKSFSRFKVISYNHPCLRSKAGTITRFNLWVTQRLFRLYDHIIFYTEQSKQWAVGQRLIRDDKCSFANNTLDTESIWKTHEFRVNCSEPPRLLFIGRLVKAKRLDLLLEYYARLQQEISGLLLDIVGDGPESGIIAEAAERDSHITWHGALTDEARIAEVMDAAHVVFVPGHSGLSIVHAFCYGKPYLTVTGPGTVHPPEIDYLRDGVNGLSLRSSLGENVAHIVNLLTDADAYQAMCDAALETAKELSVRNWSRQIQLALHCVAGNQR